MERIELKDFTNEAASMGMGKRLKDILEPLIMRNEKIIVDFDGITRFASPFFNNSFSALAIQYGFELVENIIVENISEIGQDTYESSIENAKLLCKNPQFREEIDDIISTAPKKMGC